MISNTLDVLIVDDEPININLVASLLEKDYNIQIATNGESALEIIEKREYPPHIVLADINMPKMNGFELTKTIFENEKNKDIHVLFLSANDSIEYIEKGLHLGASDYITKPIEPKKFLLKLDFWSRLINKTIENKLNFQLLEQYKSVVDTSTIVSKTTKSGIITYVNDKFCELSGYTREELIGKSHNIVRHEDISSEIFKDLWKTINEGNSWEGVIKNKKKDGTFYIVDTKITPLFDTNNIVEFIGIRHDITELEKYKEILKDELSITHKTLEENINYMRQYEDALNSITAVLKTDAQNNITYINNKFSELMGYTLEDLRGYNALKIRDLKDQEKVNCEIIRKNLENKEMTTQLITNRTKSGDKLYTVTLFYPIVDIKNNVIEHLQVMHDVTDIMKLNEEINDTQKEVVQTMGAIGETRSKETGLHVKRVAEYSYLLAKLAGLSDEKATLLKQASPMHDIGKVGIPDVILNKPGKFAIEEFDIMKTHAFLGYEMLKHSTRDILQTAATIAISHHEKYDGTGYPHGLKGENIPIEGRITAIADVFDALGHDRCYKKAWKLDKILELFREQNGIHFDPKLVKLFFDNLDQFLEIQSRMEDES